MAIMVVNTGPDVECDTGWVQRWYVTLGVDKIVQVAFPKGSAMLGLPIYTHNQG